MIKLSTQDFFKKRLHLDEEGYPVVDGVRIADEESLSEIFSSLRRSDDTDMRSPLLCTWGGVEVSVESFSAPLVVQSVVAGADQNWEASFLGGVVGEFVLDDLALDDWGRLAFYVGPQKMEAVFSRKAQATLFLALNTEREFAKFRSNSSAVSENAFWDNAYASGTDGWELGKVSPAFVALGDSVLPSSPQNVLVLGAGRGHEAAWLAECGHNVVAEDFSAQAVAEFGKRYPDSKVDYRQQDFFAPARDDEETFDVVAEFIFFCAIDPQRRREYFARVASRLKSGGLLVGIFFVSYAPGGPPYSVTPWELKAYAESEFTIRCWEMSQHSHPKRRGKEFAVVLRKR